VGQHIDRLARLPRRDRLDQGKSVARNALVDGDVLLGDIVGARLGGIRTA